MALEFAFKECGAKVKGLRVVSKAKERKAASSHSGGWYSC